MHRIFFLTTGIVSLILGIVGIVVPVLPTTPFLLLASACFLRSSPGLHRWLNNHRIFGNYLRAYERFRAVSLRAKAASLVLLWTCILCTVFFFVPILWAKVLLIITAIGVSLYLVTLKTLTIEMQEILKQERTSALEQNCSTRNSRTPHI